jgi:hypothetical protein
MSCCSVVALVALLFVVDKQDLDFIALPKAPFGQDCFCPGVARNLRLQRFERKDQTYQ